MPASLYKILHWKYRVNAIIATSQRSDPVKKIIFEEYNSYVYNIGFEAKIIPVLKIMFFFVFIMNLVVWFTQTSI